MADTLKRRNEISSDSIHVNVQHDAIISDVAANGLTLLEAKVDQMYDAQLADYPGISQTLSLPYPISEPEAPTSLDEVAYKPSRFKTASLANSSPSLDTFRKSESQFEPACHLSGGLSTALDPRPPLNEQPAFVHSSTQTES